MIFEQHITAQGEIVSPADDQDLCTLLVDLMLASQGQVQLCPDLSEHLQKNLPLVEYLPVSWKVDSAGWHWDKNILSGSDDNRWRAGVWKDGQRAGWLGGPAIAVADKQPEIAELGSPQQAQTDADWYMGLHGAWCTSCNLLAWPGAAWCAECGAASEPRQLDPCSTYSLFTYTRDYLHPTAQECWPMGVLEGVAGVRIYVPLTDPDPKIGRAYRLGIRVLRREETRTVYGWKGIRFLED